MLNKKLPIIPPLPLSRLSQQGAADCLAACAAMALAYTEQTMPYTELVKLLKIGPIGAPRRNILNLTSRGIAVTYREANLTILAETYLQVGEPVIVFVDTGELHYWSTATNHAIIVVGLDEENVVALDPAFSDSALTIPHDEFQLAWLNCDYACAIIHRQRQ
jgi:ABC-type bacteriocin/lantibiotic exporter with double-glycine peptidase domain